MRCKEKNRSIGGGWRRLPIITLALAALAGPASPLAAQITSGQLTRWRRVAARI
jgi:hypothetical protein